VDARSKKLIAGGVIAGGLMVGAAALVIGVGIAHADVLDGVDTSAYQAAIKRDGYEPGQRAVDIGEGICAHLFLGETPRQLIAELSTGQDSQMAAVFVTDASRYLCGQLS
jgi:hypothetical protein